MSYHQNIAVEAQFGIVASIKFLSASVLLQVSHCLKKFTSQEGLFVSLMSLLQLVFVESIIIGKHHMFYAVHFPISISAKVFLLHRLFCFIKLANMVTLFTLIQKCLIV